MPCNDVGESAYYASQDRKQLDELTQLLCWCCKKLNVQPTDNTIPLSLRAWWQEHQRQDEVRRKREAADL